MVKIFNGQVLFTLVLIALNSVYASQLIKLDKPFALGEPGPAFFPWLLCIFVYLAMVSILLSEIRKSSQTEQQAEPTEKTQSPTIPYMQISGPIIAIGLSVLFIVGFFYAGYVISALLYTFLITLFFNYEQSGKWKRSSIIAFITATSVTLFGWLFFVKLFDLYLPVWGG